MFQLHFERSADAIFLFDSKSEVFVDCNPAAVALLRADTKEEFLRTRLEDLSPPLQPDGRPSNEKAAEIVAWVEEHGSYRFEWLARRFDGQEVALEVVVTKIRIGGRILNVTVPRDITERKRAEAALRESEQKFRGLFEASSDGILILDAESLRIIDCNAAALRMKGGGEREWLLAQSIESLSASRQPDGRSSRDAAQGWIARALAEGPQCFEWLATRFGGEPFLVEVLLTPLCLGNCRWLVASSRDISERNNTERERAERALRESEEKFRALFEESSQGVVLHDEHRILEANPAAVRILGLQSEEELLGKHPSDTSPPFQPNQQSSAELSRRYIQECMANGSARFEWTSRTAQGKNIPLEVTLTRIEWSGRQVIQALISDISERKKVEAELRASEARLRESEGRFSVAFQASPVIIGILRMSDGQFVLANDALVNWLGCAREETVGQSCAALGMWENLADRASVWEEVSRVGTIRQRECRWRNRRGQQFTVLLSAETITLDNAPHVLLLAQDITQRKLAEAELHRTLAREMELSQLKSNFVSMVSHEFRTPLGIIQSSAELLRDFHQKMPPAEREEQLESIARNTRRMAGMMEEILVLSRLDAGKLHFQPAALDLHAFCRRVVDEVLSATNRRCHIELELGPVPARAEADEQLLGHIFTNLLSNAVKYSEPGTTVQFAVEQDGPDAVFAVRDQGIGISEEDQQHLFKAFHRGGNVGSRPGTGLGLLLVRLCADLHSGILQLKSKIGEGTTVVVRLPVFLKAP